MRTNAETPMVWWRTNRADSEARLLADRHYSRQKPGSPQFVPPGRCLVLKTRPCRAVWVTAWPFAQYVKHAWAGAWVNCLFRREGGPLLASEMIREAVAATRYRWPDVPELGMVTFIDAEKVRPKTDPGRCYYEAGFVRAGTTKDGKIAVQMLPKDMPPPRPYREVEQCLFPM